MSNGIMRKITSNLMREKNLPLPFGERSSCQGCTHLVFYSLVIVDAYRIADTPCYDAPL